MSKNTVSRRDFLQVGAVAGTALIASGILADAEPAEAQDMAMAASGEKLRFGMIGIGMQGSGLMANALELPSMVCGGAADLYDGRHILAKEIANDPNLFTTRHYEQLLNNKDIDCIVAAVPDHWHKRVVVDAVSAGKDIYCEKPMSHSVADGVEMVAAGKKTGRIIQIGSQRVSSTVCAKARALIASGALGDILSVEGSLGRNDPTGAWEYPVPSDLSPETLDWDTWQGTVPKRDFDGKLFARWRCWREYGTGVAGDLIVHLISGMMYMLNINEPPKRATTLGGITRWKDGRNMPDINLSLFEYGSVPVYIRISLGTETPEVYRIMGSKGLLEVNEFGFTFQPQPGIDLGPSYYAQGFPKAMREEYFKQWHAENDAAVAKAQSSEGLVYKSNSWDDLKPHLHNFFNAVKTRKPVVEDVVFGHHAAIACHMGNESFFRQKGVTWDAATNTIKS